MNTVVKSENFRLKKSKEIWSMAGILIGLQVLFVAAYFILRNFSFFDQIESMFTGNDFFSGFANLVNDGLFRILLIVMIGSLVTKLYQTGVTKQLVSCGINRKKVILGQFVSFTTIFSLVAVIASTVSGIANILLKGRFGFDSINLGRFGLSLIGMVVVVASLCALYLLIAHLTGSLGAAIILGLFFQMVLPHGISLVAGLTHMNFLNDYFLNTLQKNAVSMDISVGSQLLNIGLLAAVTVILLGLCQIVFRHKEVK